MLGDTDYSDTQYVGEQSTSVLSLDYYRNKARDFQVTLDSLDATRAAAQQAIDADISEELTEALYADLQDFEAKRATLRYTAEAINAGAAVVNSLGGRFPQLSIPTGLGLLPVIPVAAIAAIGTAAALIVWGNTWLEGVNSRLKQAALLMAVDDPDKRAALASSIAQSDAALARSVGTTASNVANIVKWGAIGVAAFMLFQAFKLHKGA